MTSLGLRLIDEDAPPPPRPEPQVLTRTVTVPPGLPWDQTRAAHLEARHSAPLPMAEISYQIRRLEGWRPGAPGRFAAFYILARDVSGRVDADVDVDGRSVRVTFLAPGAVRREARSAALLTVVIVMAALVVTAAVGAAIVRRASVDSELSALETRTTAKLHAVEAREHLKAQSRALAARLDRGGRVKDVLGDLIWASSAKNPDAHIEAFHWEPGLLAVEVRGTASPFLSTDRELRRSPKPVRRGVWLWGMERPANGADVTAKP